MKIKWLSVLMAAVLFCMCGAAYAEEMTGRTALDIVAEMGIGWNLGNTFDATGGDPADIYSQEQSWGNPIVDAALIKRVKDAGFTTIRIPVTWYRHVSDDGTYTIDPAFLARIREVVDYAYAEGMYIILNMHHEAWLNVPALDKDYEQIGVQLVAMWRQIADSFADYDQHLIFEAMNEPRMAGTGVEWNGNRGGYDAVNYLNQVFAEAIRKDAKGYNGERCLMIPGYAASSGTPAMAAIEIPVVDGAPLNNVIISVHCYSPYDFCLSDKQKVFVPTNKQHTSSIDSVFTNVQKLFLDKGIPVVIGETSATNTGNNTEDRERWAYYMGSKAAAYGVPIIVWDNGNNATSGGECHAWVRRSQNAKLRSQANPLPFPTVVEKLMAGASSVAWGTGREAPKAVKSAINGKIIWASEEGLKSAKEWDSSYIKVASNADWYGPSVMFAVIYEGNGTPNLVLDSAEMGQWWIPVTPDRTDKMGSRQVAWFSYNKVMAECQKCGVTDPAQLSSFCVMAVNGSITTYEVCYIGK